MKKLCCTLALLLSHCLLVKAQPSVRPSQFICGIKDLTTAQATALTQQAMLALKKKMATRAAFTTITYVPIRPHIMRRSDGTAEFTLARLNKVMAATNSYFLLNGSGIQFYFAGDTPEYYDDDFYYNNGYILYDDDPNALNQYYCYFIHGNSPSYAYYPYDNVSSTESVIAVGTEGNDQLLGNQTIPHELGHTFSLIHTFGENNGTAPTSELVTRGTGANCTTNGDLICDTPADPYLIPGANLIFSNGCPQYDPNSIARDANGDAYSPSVTNIMSYYFPCTHDFTPGQYERIQAGLALRQTHTTYKLDFPATNVVPASNLTATSTGVAVMLTWQDNADNEMGYFIERSTSPTTDFVPIGGVAPNETNFVDTKVTAQTQYYYRIRPSNTTTGSISPTIPVLTLPASQCQVPTNQSVSMLVTSAVLSWEQAGLNVSYDLRYRVVGTNNWTNISNVTSTSVNITGLTGSTTYEWQVRTVCDNSGIPSNFSLSQSFGTFFCIPPWNLQTMNVTTNSAQLSWTYEIANAETSYQVRYRIVGTTDWIMVTNQPTSTTGSSLTLTELSSNTTYEWQVRALCSATEASDFQSSPDNIQTLPIEPDLTPILYVRPSPTYGNTALSVVLDLVELNSRSTSGLITVKITKDPQVGLTFEDGLISVGGRSVQNGFWSFTSSEANYYVLTTTQPIEAGGKLSVGLNGILSPGATTGRVTISATVLGSNTADSKPANNIDADKIDYFQQ